VTIALRTITTTIKNKKIHFQIIIIIIPMNSIIPSKIPIKSIALMITKIIISILIITIQTIINLEISRA
jgi:hypothetical protein